VILTRIGAPIEQVIPNTELTEVMKNGTEEHNQRLEINDRAIKLTLSGIISVCRQYLAELKHNFTSRMK